MKILFSFLLFIGFAPQAQAGFMMGYILGSTSSSSSIKTSGGQEFLKVCALRSKGFDGLSCNCEKVSLVNIGAILEIYEVDGITKVTYGNSKACLPVKLKDLIKELEQGKKDK